MRLLKLEQTGELTLAEFLACDIPPYAILSLTWGAAGEEVSFRDVVDGAGKSKTGYKKIEFCAKQAAKDGFDYFWIDTCAIDKSSSAELSEAINSMFRWYRDAERCYVYLTDVTISNGIPWKQQFESSRWFTRGWTLQELLAPETVEFFSSEGELLGNKESLAESISKITNLTPDALQAQDLSLFSVNDRLSWQNGRMTTREEDMAYSSMGIFDVFMPLIYGEGLNKAITRLHKAIEENNRDSVGPSKYQSFAQVYVMT
ncbi:HET-domain-containing protein [Microthyrium microscopicum]|uniref:HET-domain-containing protein n=1 Tax=Microthyrium microscopicum TaxID=703497 RepID=A0A6A6UIL1_9PEZI|nr:HET-domain-containing protein [Microthyrium microscopicum]